MNIKLFKMIFNRALRIKSRDSKVGEKMFIYLRERLATMLGSGDTYYDSSLCFELVRISTQHDKTEDALNYLEEGRKILEEHYGGQNSPNYIDYYLRKVELYVNLVLDANNAMKDKKKDPEDRMT